MRLMPSGILCCSSSTWPSQRPWELRHTACTKDVPTAQRSSVSRVWLNRDQGIGALYVAGG